MFEVGLMIYTELTKKAINMIEQINPIIKKSTSYVRRLEIDEEDKSIKFMTFFGDVIHRHYYSQNTNAIARKSKSEGLLMVICI